MLSHSIMRVTFLTRKEGGTTHSNGAVADGPLRAPSLGLERERLVSVHLCPQMAPCGFELLFALMPPAA